MTGDAPLVLVTSRSFGSGTVDTVGRLEAHGLDVHRAGSAHDLEDLDDVLSDVDAWIAGTAPIGPAHLDAARGLRLVARYGVGVDAVDLDAAAARGVVVTNTPGANATAVAEHAVGLMLAALRHTVAADRSVREGTRSANPGRELGAATVGLVGFGTIGRAVARLVRAFGAEVVAHDPYVDTAEVELVGLHELCERSDIVSLHAAGNDLLLDASAIDRLHPEVVVVNTARAGLVDEEALARALHRGRLAAVASDVTEGGDNALLGAPRTVLTPHVAAQTIQAIDRMGEAAVDECLRVLVRDEPPLHAVTPTQEQS